MKVRFVSDFHAEFWDSSDTRKFNRILNKYLPKQDDDKETVIVCAGDMGTYYSFDLTYGKLLKALGRRFRAVVIVPGNHSWYGTCGVWGYERDFFKDKKLPKNVHYLDDDFVAIDDVIFIGACLWTDFDGMDESAMDFADYAMADYKHIRTGVRGGPYHQSPGITPMLTVKRHDTSVTVIKNLLTHFRGKKCVVVTHHAPSPLSINPKYEKSLLTPAFYTDLTELIQHYEPVVWCHGHMHDSCAYEIGNTQVICNPLGYHPNGINRLFVPGLTLEI